MNDPCVIFFGSDEDLDELRRTLIAAGFKEREEIGKCIRTYLQTRSKRMVSRMISEGEEKITIRGDFSTKEIERLLKIPYNLDIEDDK